MERVIIHIDMVGYHTYQQSAGSHSSLIWLVMHMYEQKEQMSVMSDMSVHPLLPAAQDCFFASVAEAEHPILRGKPLVVSHSASAQGRGEVGAPRHGIGTCTSCACSTNSTESGTITRNKLTQIQPWHGTTTPQLT